MRAVRAWGVAGLTVLIWSGSAAPQADPPVWVRVLEARRAALFELLGTGVAVLRSAERLELSEHPQASDFRQDNNFYYFTGLETPGSWLILVARVSGPDSAILYLPPRNPRQERWTGPQAGPGPETVARTGVSEVRSVERFAAEIAERLGHAGGPLFVSQNARRRGPEFFHDTGSGGPVEVRGLDRVVATLRLVKDSAEVARLRRAIAITTEAQRAAMRAARPGMHEYELEALIEYVFRKNGAERVGFPSIVASGPNSVILHYDRNGRRMASGDLVVADIGAEFGYYSADVTRTFPVSGEFTPRQRAIYELVLATEQATIDSVKPGVTLAELNRLARRFMRENSGGLCGERACDEYFVHGIGHWLGMDVHDVGDYATALRPGMVLTIEPGIYLPDESLGVRIEDDLLVTEDGAEVLSSGAPRAAAEIEALMREPPGAPVRADATGRDRGNEKR